MTTTNRFLDWYSDELDALRARASQFAKKHNKIARYLGFDERTSNDPHVERIIQSFSYTAARIRKKLDDEFPELTDTFLDALYPHYLAQIPSVTILQFQPKSDQDEAMTVPRDFGVKTQPLQGSHCQYRTTQSMSLMPVSADAVALENAPFAMPAGCTQTHASACLTLKIQGNFPQGGFGDMPPDSLRFYINNGSFNNRTALYEMLLNQCTGLCLARHPDDKQAINIPKSAIKPVGFTPDEALLPATKRNFAGFGLLTDFFVLPEKFLFFDLTGLSDFLRTHSGQSVLLYVYFKAPASETLRRSITKDSLALHVTPAVNLFQQQAEPVHVDYTQSDYDLIASHRHNTTQEVYRIESVTFDRRNGIKQDVHPMFAQHRMHHDSEVQFYWQHKRTYDVEDDITTSKISLVDTALDPEMTSYQGLLIVETVCLNRRLPEKLLTRGVELTFQAAQNTGGYEAIGCLHAPTRTQRFNATEQTYWKLIAHMTSNHQPLLSGDVEALRDVLNLYNFDHDAQFSQLTGGIVRLDSRRETARLRDGTIASGMHVTLEFNDDMVSRGLAYLFGMVFSRFLGLYASINTFTQLTVGFVGHKTPVAVFEPRTQADEVTDL